jgi:hypothetical protein
MRALGKQFQARATESPQFSRQTSTLGCIRTTASPACSGSPGCQRSFLGSRRERLAQALGLGVLSAEEILAF